MPSGPSDVERFWSYVVKGKPDECWPWRTGRKSVFCWRVGGVRHQSLASRVAFLLSGGTLDGSRSHVVMHSCNNPPCCNPAHLFAGRQQQNVLDAIRDGLRTYDSAAYKASRRVPQLNPARGEMNGSARHTDADVAAMRALYAEGVEQTEIARRFGASKGYVWRIVHHRLR